MTKHCDNLAGELGELFTCVITERHAKIRTPFLYPDGDNIDLFVTEKDGSLVVSDLGETLRWLRSQTLLRSRSAALYQPVRRQRRRLGERRLQPVGFVVRSSAVV